MALVKIENIKKTFSGIEVLKGISFSLDAGKQYVIRGPSGSGKSTLFYLLGGLDRPTSGNIFIDGLNLYAMNDDELANFRNQFVGFVFQFHFLLSSMNCLDNILLPAKIGNHNILEVEKFALSNAQILGVEHCLKKFPYELSGGEQQRINVIRALSLRPKLILCDEPTGSLDSKNSQIVVGLLKEMAAKYASTLVVVTHDDYIASQFQNHFALNDGQLMK